eukprot:881983-Rhodomonas_salina.4
MSNSVALFNHVSSEEGEDSLPIRVRLSNKVNVPRSFNFSKHETSSLAQLVIRLGSRRQNQPCHKPFRKRKKAAAADKVRATPIQPGLCATGTHNSEIMSFSSRPANSRHRHRERIEMHASGHRSVTGDRKIE